MQASTSGSFELREYSAGDEQHIARLWEETFGQAPSPGHWQWKFRSNPHGEPIIALFTGPGDGAVLGHHAMTPVQLSYLGRRLLAYQSVDAMLSPSVRGRGVFPKLLERCIGTAREQNADVVFAAANHDSYAPLVQHGLHEKLGYFSRYAVRSAPGMGSSAGKAMRAAGVLFRSARAARFELRRAALPWSRQDDEFGHCDRLPDDYDALWRRSRATEVFSIWKDSRYMKWRYDDCPTIQYGYCTLRTSGELAALCVYSTSGNGKASIADIVTPINSIEAVTGAQRLIAYATSRLLRHGASIVGFYGMAPGHFDALFRGYSRRVAFNFPFVTRTLSADEHVRRLMARPGNWLVGWGDTDTV